MLPPCCQETGLPGERRWSVTPSPWRTDLGAGDGSGIGEETGGRQGRGLRHGRDVRGGGTACTSPDAGGEGEGERKGAGLGDWGRLKVWKKTLR